MKQLAAIVSVITFCFSAQLCAKDAKSALQRYWKDICFSQNTLSENITDNYIQYSASGNRRSRQELETLFVNFNTLCAAAKKNDFPTAYNALVNIMKTSAKGKKSSPRPASEISPKDREQFMTMMKRLAEDQPSKSALEKFNSLTIISNETVNGSTVFEISFSNFNQLRRSRITVVKVNNRYLVSEERELPLNNRKGFLQP